MGKKHAIFFPYGRTGLLFLLEALGISDQEIICPAYTCVVVPHAIVLSRNEPVFVDSNPDTFNLLTLRSFGESFYHHITDAALEFGYVGV